MMPLEVIARLEIKIGEHLPWAQMRDNSTKKAGLQRIWLSWVNPVNPFTKTIRTNKDGEVQRGPTTSGKADERGKYRH